MCGITGALWTDPNLSIDHDTLARMTDILQHRGPDDRGMYSSKFQTRTAFEGMPGIALGHRRLSIIDIEGGHQPMANEDQSVWVVFNGEIYNYQALRQRLEGSGHRLRSKSDTEVIVHLYEDEGLDSFRHLNGMFAIGIWDAKRRRMVLARDRLGQKPLVYYVTPERLLFASELKSLLQVPGVPREIDPAAVDEYLTYQYVPYPHTIFADIHKLPPGNFGVFQDGRWQTSEYWSPDWNRIDQQSSDYYTEHLKELMISSVDLRMQSDVPVGAFLSGGMDSSIIAALMQQKASTPIKTFSVGFPVPEYDETRYARQVANHLGTEHHEFQVTSDCVKVLPQLVWHFDEPFADSSAIPTWYLSQWTREHVTVALSGDGGDELFAGYPRYQAVSAGQLFDALPSPIKALLGSRLWQYLPADIRQKSLRRRIKRFTLALASPPLQRYLEWIEIFHEAQRADLYTEDFLSRLPTSDPADFLKRAWSQISKRDVVGQASLADLQTYLPCDLMTKVDIASMSHSLECRQPFLDHRVVEMAIHMPTSLKYRRLRGKRILWKTFANLLPREISARRKMGFGIPLDHWFRNELRDITHDTLLDTSNMSCGMFQHETIRRIVDEHMTRTFDHSYRLWALLVLELWMRRWCHL